MNSRIAIIGVFLILCQGCAGKSNGPVTGSLQGKVTLKGEPFHEGSVSIYSAASGSGSQIPLDAEGRYSTSRVLPVGEYEVFIAPPAFTPPRPGEKRAPAKSTIPTEYTSATTSELRVTINPGANTFDINMLP